MVELPKDFSKKLDLMMQKTEDKLNDIISFFDNLSEEKKLEFNKKQFEGANKEHEEFLKFFNKEQCYICSKSLSTFSKKKPCLHWLLKPRGFEKTHLQDVASSYSMGQIEAYLRWVANQDIFASNINEISEKGASSKFLEITIRYKQLEWSISCSESDFNGHPTSKFAQHPHYHLEMRVNGKPFIKFNDFHLPLHRPDILGLKVKTANSFVKIKCLFGEGVDDLINEIVETDGRALENMKLLGAPGNAPLHFSTLILADEGKTLSGDEIVDAINRAKAMNVPVTSEIHKISNSRTRTIITPADNVVKKTIRSSRKNRKKDNE